MKIKVSYEKKKYALDLKPGETVRDILGKISVSPEMVLVSRNGKFVPDTDEVNPRDKIEILKVVSGG